MKKTDLTKRLLITLGILVLYRIGTYIPVPCIDFAKLSEFSKVAKTGIFGMFNMFSGGSMARISIFGLGIMPYITASIIMQLLMAGIPNLKQLRTEGGESGRHQISMYTKYLTLVIGLMQGFIFADGFMSMGLYTGSMSPTLFKLEIAVIMLASTMILMWLGNICTAHGIGNGSSLIIFAGIVAEAPKDLANAFQMSKTGALSSLMLLLLFIIFIATIFLVVYIERANRLIYIQHPRQSQSFLDPRMTMPKENFLPLKVNTAGVVPPIFASALLLLPATLLTFLEDKTSGFGYFVANNFAHGKPMFAIFYVALIVFFTFFYNKVIFDVEDIANNLKKGSLFIPGCRPGAATVELLRKIVSRLSLIAALYLTIICSIPEFLSPVYGYSFLLGGTGILIVVNVIIDTAVNIQTSLLSAKYAKALKKYNK